LIKTEILKTANSMNNVHPTALVSSKAQLGENVRVDAYAIIKDDVVIGDGTYIGPHAVVYDGARIGKRVKIYQSASIAHIPQDLKFDNDESIAEIGDDTVIHEFVTIHRGTKETRLTKIGSNVLLMAYAHVAHDCIIGDKCILANSVQIAGHVSVDDWTIIGGTTPVHQFCKIGKHCMIGGGFRVTQDVPPFILAAQEPLQYEGLNVVGLRRRGFSNEQIMMLKNVYHYIYKSQLNVSQAKEKIIEEFGSEPHAQEVLTFLNASKRGLIGK